MLVSDEVINGQENHLYRSRMFIFVFYIPVNLVSFVRLQTENFGCFSDTTISKLFFDWINLKSSEFLWQKKTYFLKKNLKFHKQNVVKLKELSIFLDFLKLEQVESHMNDIGTCENLRLHEE